MPGKTILAIICITPLLGIALLKDIDGVLLTSGIGVIAGLGGWAIHKAKNP